MFNIFTYFEILSIYFVIVAIIVTTFKPNILKFSHPTYNIHLKLCKAMINKCRNILTLIQKLKT